MRRFAAAVVITVIGLYLTLSYKSSPVTHVAAASTPAPSSTALPADTGVTPPAGGPPPSDTTPTPTPTPTTAVATTVPPLAVTGTRTLTGAVIPTQYGDVQVALVVTGSHITDVKALQLPFDRARSQFISQQAAPILRQEVLDAQGPQIDTVSGASYTSDAYAQSVQSALDQATG